MKSFAFLILSEGPSLSRYLDSVLLGRRGTYDNAR